MKKLALRTHFASSPYGWEIKLVGALADNKRYGYNGKERDNDVKGEGNLLDLGASEFDTRIATMFSIDPRASEYAWQSPYAYFGSSPINQIDFNGEGDYYDKEGKHLGSDGKTKTVGEGKNVKQVPDDKAYITSAELIKQNTNSIGITDWTKVQNNQNTTDLTAKYGLSNTDLINRAHWAYGEGTGNYLDYYAHTIKNLRIHGLSGRKPYESDQKMFEQKMTHKNTEGKLLNFYPGYFSGTEGSPNAKEFAKARKNLHTLTDDPKLRAAIKAVISSVMGTTKDPTSGATQWVGGSGSKGNIVKYPEINNATNITNVTSGTDKQMR